MKTIISLTGAGILFASLVSVAQAQTPKITAQPTNETVLAGGAASFTVAVSGTGPFSYQWQLNGTNLPPRIITTVAGNGYYNPNAGGGYFGDGGPATNAELANLGGVAVDASGNLFVAETEYNVILKVATNGIITTVVGGTNGLGDGGAATNAGLFAPWGVAVDASGSLFIADTANQRIRRVGTNGIITTVAGNGTYGYSGDGGPATSAELNGPAGMTVDASGNLFIADRDNQRIRKVGTNGIITTAAGNGYYNTNRGGGYSGDGGPATKAELYYPSGVAVDASGNLFVAGNNVIRKVGTNGIITTMAGNGIEGYSGDGGPVTSAELNNPAGVTVDGSGNLFITDEFNERIRKAGTDGIITTVAGNGTEGYSGDGGAATNAELNDPAGVVVDGSGNLFIADQGNNRIRKVVFQGQSPSLVLANVGGANAGDYDVVVSSPYGSVTSSVVTLVVLLPPTIVTEPESRGIALGSNGSLNVAVTGTPPFDYQWYFDGAPLLGQTNTTLVINAIGYTNVGSYDVVVTNQYGSVTSAMAVVTVGIPPRIADQSGSQFSPLDGSAAFSVAVSGTGPFTYQWQFDGTNLSESVITTVAGDGIYGYSGDGSAATNAELGNPSGVSADAFGNLFIADTGHNVIRELGTDGIITTVAGKGTYGYSGDGDTATSAELINPADVVVDEFGNLFIADIGNSVIRKVGTNGIITTVAGNGTHGYSGDGGAATNAELANPGGVAVDASGNLFIADTGNSVIRKVAINGIISTVAGNGTNGYSGDGGVATNAELANHGGVAVDAYGNLFIADTDNSVIRKIGIDGIISTVAGNYQLGGSYSGDGGPATNAALNHPTGIALDAYGNLFIADSSRIREVGTDGIITTVAGNGTGGYSGDGGAATNAELEPLFLFGGYYPMGVAVDASGNLFIADDGNQRIRKVVLPGPTLALNHVSGANVGEYDVVVSSPYGSVTSSVVSLVVLVPPTINIQPLTQAILLGSNATLSVAASGAAPLNYQWYFDGAPLNDQTNNTLPLIAAAITNAGSYSVVIQNLYGSVTSAVAVVSVGTAPRITTQPVSQTNLFSSAASFSVAVSGTSPLKYQWQFNGTNLPNGVITTVAGNGFGAGSFSQHGGYSGDGGSAISAELSYPFGVAVDAFGNLFIADRFNNRVRKVGTDGIISTVAGNGTGAYSGDGGLATSAEVFSPLGVAMDATGNLFIADSGNNRIRKLGDKGIITTAVGSASNDYSGDGGNATNAGLFGPWGVAVDASGNLFIAEPSVGVIRKVGTNGIITTVAGNYPSGGGYGGDGGAATNAGVSSIGVAVDSFGNLFIADTYNNRIRKVGTDGIITTVAGNGYYDPNTGGGYSGDGGPATNAALNSPFGVAVDAFGNLFIADTYNNRIREVGTDGIISTVAGNGAGGFSGDGDVATNAELLSPTGVALDSSGNFFIADLNNQRIREVVFEGTTLVLTNVGGANAGVYDVVVSSPYGSVTSSVVSLDVTIPPLKALSSGGQEVQLQFQGVPGNSYVLLSATDLTPPVDWRPVVTNAAETNGNWAFTVSIVPSDHAVFYTYRGSNSGQ